LVKLPAVVLESLIAKQSSLFPWKSPATRLNGGLLILKPDTLAHWWPTDGHRLALAETDQKLAGLNGEVRRPDPKKSHWTKSKKLFRCGRF